MKTRSVLICISHVAVLLVMAGCSSSSIVGDAEKTLRAAIESQSKGQIKLVKFTKKDGRKLEAMGNQGYELIYEAEIQFASDGMWVTGATISSGIGFNFDVLTGPRPKSISADLMKFAVSGKDVNRGGRAKFSGTMVGQKYESGWKFTIGSAEITSEPAAKGSTEGATDSRQANDSRNPDERQGQAFGRNDPANKTPTNQSPRIPPRIANLINVAEGSATPSEADAARVITAIVKTEIGFIRSETRVRNVSEKAVLKAIEPLSKRGDNSGGNEPFIQLGKENRILIQLPGFSEEAIESAKMAIQKAVLLEFRLVHPDSNKLLSFNLGAPGYESLPLKAARRENAKTETRFLVRRMPSLQLTGEYMKPVGVNRHPGSNRLEISLSFDDAERFAEKAKENTGRFLGLVLDGELYLAPRIHESIPRANAPMEIINAFDITLADLRKSNGQRGEWQGFPIYKLEFEGKIEFALDLEKLRKVLEWDEEAERKAIDGLKSLEGKANSEPTNRWKEAISGVIQFEKTEKGWRVDEPVHVVDAKPTSAETVKSYLVSPEILRIQKRRENMAMTSQSSKLNVCINNLRQIDGAKEQWALENKKRAGTVTTAAADKAAIDAFVYGGAPICPDGGVYTYNVVDALPTCSIAGHTLGKP